MTALERLRSVRPRTWLLAAALAAAALILAGEWQAFRAATRLESAPRRAVSVKALRRYQPDVLETRLRAWRPAAAAARKLEQRAGIPIRAAGEPAGEGHDLLAHVELEPLCEGGELLITLPPGDGEREVEVTVLPAPRRLLGLRSAYEVGALYGRGFNGEDRGRAWAAVEPLRFGRLHLRGEAGVDLRGGEADAYVIAGIVWRPR